MEDKKLIGVGIVGAALLATGLALAKKKPDGEEAALIIEVYDSQGNLVPRNSPLTLKI